MCKITHKFKKSYFLFLNGTAKMAKMHMIKSNKGFPAFGIGTILETFLYTFILFDWFLSLIDWDILLSAFVPLFSFAVPFESSTPLSSISFEMSVPSRSLKPFVEFSSNPLVL